MSQYLQGTERSIETCNIHSLAVKAAYQLGLHSPNALKQYPEPEREFRKRTWFGCVLLDRSVVCSDSSSRTADNSRSFSMTLGRPPLIPREFVKLDLPCPSASLSDSESMSHQNSIIDDGVQFFTATM